MLPISLNIEVPRPYRHELVADILEKGLVEPLWNDLPHAMWAAANRMNDGADRIPLLIPELSKLVSDEVARQSERLTWLAGQSAHYIMAVYTCALGSRQDAPDVKVYVMELWTTGGGLLGPSAQVWEESADLQNAIREYLMSLLGIA